jgi:microcystin-dependent protein
MSLPYVGEIKLVPYNFAPVGWLFCHGQILPISENETLFQLIGTTYGGDGETTFALPDLRGRTVLGRNASYQLAEMGGAEVVALTSAQIPAHNHSLAVSSEDGTAAAPGGKILAKSTLANQKPYGGTQATAVAMPASAIGSAGGSAPHDNMQPYTVLNYIIALYGIFPSPN